MFSRASISYRSNPVSGAVQQLLELYLVPLARHFVHGDVELLLCGLVEVNNRDIRLGDALVHKHGETLVAGHDTVRALVPDYWDYHAEPVNVPLELLILVIAGHELHARVILRALHVRDSLFDNFHQISPFALFTSSCASSTLPAGFSSMYLSIAS